MWSLVPAVVLTTIALFLVRTGYDLVWRPLFSCLRKFPHPPRKHWLTGDIHLYRDKNLGMFAELGRKLGTWVFVTDFFWWPVLWIGDPEAAAEVLGKPDVFVKDGLPEYKLLSFMMGQDGLVPEIRSTYHAVARKRINPAFSLNHINHLVPVFDQQGEVCISLWRKFAGTNQPVAVARDLANLTLDVIGVAVFDYNFHTQQPEQKNADDPLRDISLYDVILDMVTAFEWNVMTLFPGWTWMWWLEPLRICRRVNRVLDMLCYFAIERKRQQRREQQHHEHPRKSILDLLMDAEDDDDGVRFNDRQLRDHVCSFLLAGHDTTATAMTWALLYMAQYPHYALQLQTELDRVYGPYLGEPIHPTAANIDQCQFLTFFCKEVLRIKPVISCVSRTTKDDTTIQGKRVQSGRTIVIAPRLLHYNTEYWDKPDEFIPERWEDEATLLRHPAQYMPFLRGPRNCVGMKFADVEMRVILAKIAHQFTFHAPHGVNYKESVLIVSRPDPELSLFITERPLHQAAT